MSTYHYLNRDGSRGVHTGSREPLNLPAKVALKTTYSRLRLRLLMCGCGVPVSMPCGRCAEISLYCVYRCCIDLPSQTVVKTPRTMAAVLYMLLKINFRALTANSINSSKLLGETLITGTLEARVRRERCRRAQTPGCLDCAWSQAKVT